MVMVGLLRKLCQFIQKSILLHTIPQRVQISIEENCTFNVGHNKHGQLWSGKSHTQVFDFLKAGSIFFCFREQVELSLSVAADK